MYVFNRSININIQTEDGNIVTVNGVFIDSYHELCLTLTADINTFEINSAEGELRRFPHSDCSQTQKQIKNLVGLKLERGVSKEIRKAVGGQKGCTHLSDLALECIKALIQAKYSLMHETMSPEEIKNKTEKILQGSCYHFRVK